MGRGSCWLRVCVGGVRTVLIELTGEVRHGRRCWYRDGGPSIAFVQYRALHDEVLPSVRIRDSYVLIHEYIYEHMTTCMNTPPER